MIRKFTLSLIGSSESRAVTALSADVPSWFPPSRVHVKTHYSRVPYKAYPSVDGPRYALWEVMRYERSIFGVKPRFGGSPTLCLMGVYAL